MYCPQCKGEYREGFTQCADCQMPLVDELPQAEPDETPVDFVEVLSAADPGLIALVKSVLESEEIPYVTHGEHFSRLFGTMPVRILVAKEDIDTARDVLKDFLSET